MGKFGLEVLTDTISRGFDLPFGVEKPDVDGCIQKWEDLENCQFWERKKL